MSLSRNKVHQTFQAGFSDPAFLLMFTDKYISSLRKLPVEPLLAAGTALGILTVLRSWFFLLFVPLFFLFPKRNTVAALLCFMLAGLSAFWQIPREIPEDMYGSAKILITDMRLAQVEGLKPPALIAAEILAFCPTGETYTPLREKTFLRLPYGSTLNPVPGAVYQAEGLLAAPPAEGFANYLAARKVKRTFQLDKIEKISPPGTWRYPLVCLRDAILRHTLDGISDTESRTRIAGLFFNAGGGLSRESREQFLRSGTVHIFSVSGMHVAMLAALLFALLRFVPTPYREGVILTILTLYVISTGANPPALRALGMIGTFLVLRMFSLQTPPVRVLALLAAVFLLFSPGLLFDIGFLYSFIITAALLLAARQLRLGRNLFQSTARLTLRHEDMKRIWRNTKPMTILLNSGGIALIAFWSGLAISVCSRGLFLPGSIAANILLLPLVPLLFFLLGFKLLTGFLPFGAFLLTAGFRVLDAVTGITAGMLDALPVIRPALWEAAVFYGALFILLTAHKGRNRLIAGVFSLLLVLSWVIRPAWEPPFTAVFTADAGTPVMIVEAVPAQNRATVFNVPSSDMGYEAADLLLRKGITKVEFIRFSRPQRDYSRGTKALASQLPVKRLELPQKSHKNFRKTLLKDFPPEKLHPCSTPFEPAAIQNEDNGWKITLRNREYHIPYTRKVRCTFLVQNGDAGKTPF